MCLACVGAAGPELAVVLGGFAAVRFGRPVARLRAARSGTATEAASPTDATAVDASAPSDLSSTDGAPMRPDGQREGDPLTP